MMKKSKIMSLMAGLKLFITTAYSAGPDASAMDEINSLKEEQVPVSVKEFKNLEYTKFKGKSMELDLRVPTGKGPHPLIIWIHGGAFKWGNRNWIKPGAIKQTGRGYALASVSYTLSGEEKWPTQINQVKSAVRWLRANAKKYNLDPNTFIVWGESAGAHLSNMVGTTGGVKEFNDSSLGNEGVSDRVQGVVSWYSPVDFLKMGGYHNEANSPESELLGGAVQTLPEKAKTANPITYVTPDEPPFYIMHGTGDELVPHSGSVLLNEALKKAGVDSTFISLEGYSHGDSRFNTGDRIKGVEEFIDRIRAKK